MKKALILFAAGLVALGASAAGEIRSLPPGGETVVYIRSSKSYYNVPGWGPGADYDYFNASSITYYDNGDVYMSEPFNSIETNTYIKGRKEGNKLIFDLTDQPIHTLRDADYVLQLWAKRVVYRAEFKSMKPSDDQELVFYIREDGTIEMEGDQASLDTVVMLGMCDQYNMWRNYGEQLMKFEPLTDDMVPATMPEGVETETWDLLSTESSYPVEVAIDGNNLYIKNIFTDLPGSVLKGYINGDIVTFDEAPYLGVAYNHHVYALPTTVVETFDEFYGVWTTNTDWLVNCVFDFDAEAKILKCKNDIMFNAGTTMLSEISTLHRPLITGPGVAYPYAKLESPRIGNFTPYKFYEDEGIGYGRFVFEVRRFDEDEAPLAKDNLYFQIFFNHETEPYTFKESEYYGLKKDTKEFPYGFGDNNNFAYEGDQYEYCFFWRKDVTSAGVRSVYYYNGEPIYSDIVWSDGWTGGQGDGVENVSVDTPVIGTEYYDLSGRKADWQSPGFRIKVEKHADGTLSTTKIAK